MQHTRRFHSGMTIELLITELNDYITVLETQLDERLGPGTAVVFRESVDAGSQRIQNVARSQKGTDAINRDEAQHLVKTAINSIDVRSNDPINIVRSTAQPVFEVSLPSVEGVGAPNNSEFLVGLSDANLTAERVVTDTPTITWDLATASQAKANVAQLDIGWSVTNGSTDKALNVTADTLTQVAAVLGTLIDLLKSKGILGA